MYFEITEISKAVVVSATGLCYFGKDIFKIFRMGLKLFGLKNKR